MKVLAVSGRCCRCFLGGQSGYNFRGRWADLFDFYDPTTSGVLTDATFNGPLLETMKEDPIKAYLAKIGAKGRAVNSVAQKETARANGKKGGRPKGAKDRKPRSRSAT